MKVVFSLLIALMISGCGSTAALNKHGNQVAIVETEPVECEDLGTFYGSGTEPKYALNNLRNVVGEYGGNSVFLTRGEVVTRAPLSNTVMVMGNDNTIYGRGFRCRVRYGSAFRLGSQDSLSS